MFISDQILLKLECDIFGYLYIPFVGTKHIKANNKLVLEALIQRYCLHGILSMSYICKVWKRCVFVMRDNQYVYWCIFDIPKSIFIS